MVRHASFGRMLGLPDGIERLNVRIGEHFIDLVNRAERHVMAFKLGHPLGARPGRKALGEFHVKFRIGFDTGQVV